MTHASRAESASSSVDERSARTFEGLRNLVARVTPWLIDVGSWIFGGLTAINLVVISALITVGPVASAIKISTAALAAALPLNVAGILLLRLINDLKEVGIDGLTLRAFQDAGFPHTDAASGGASRIEGVPLSAGYCVTTGTFQLAGSPTQPHGVGCSSILF